MSTAAAGSSSSDEAIPLSDVLQKLSMALLSEFASGVNVKVKSSAPKKVVAETLVNEAYAQGTQFLFKQLEKEQLKSTVEALGLTVDTNDKSKLLKRINEKLKEQKTLDDFLDQLTTDVLQEFCKALDFEEDTTEKGALINAVLDETIIAGMRHLYDKMTREFIEDIAKSLGCKSTGTKKDVVRRILGLSYKQLLDTTKTSGGDQPKEKRTDRTNLDIKKGVTTDELFQTYYATELRNYCREHGLLLSGSRRDLCKRIAAFVNGDEVSAKKGGKKKKKSAATDAAASSKKRKRSEKSKKDTEKPAEDKKEADKKEADKKEADKKEATAAEKKDIPSAPAPASTETKSESSASSSGKPPAKKTKK